MIRRRVIGITLWLLGGLSQTAYAHEDAVLSSPVQRVVVGGTLTLEGRDFGSGREYSLKLVGVFRVHALRSIRADSTGRFSTTIALPEAALPGQYRVVAVATDGDRVARLDVAVEALAGASDHGVSQPGPRTAHSGADPGPLKVSAGARALMVERNRGSLEWALIGSLVAVSGLLGIALLGFDSNANRVESTKLSGRAC